MIAPAVVRYDAVDLVARARRGDASALDHIARAELPRVERLLFKLLGPRGDLEDLVQTVFVETFRSLHRFRGDSKISTFVGGITVRVARRAMRPTAWQRRRREMPDENVAPGPSPESTAMAREQLRRVHAALEKVSAKKRIAFLLWSLEGMSPQQIAKLTDASVSATRSRIFYAQKELKKAAQRDPYLRQLIGGRDDA